MAIMSDTDVIDALDIFRWKTPVGIHRLQLQKETWKKKNEISRVRITFSPTVKEQLGSIEEGTAAGLFEQVSMGNHLRKRLLRTYQPQGWKTMTTMTYMT